jgi:PAS domain S-box-containing protein
MVVSVVRDISERKKNEAMLAESEERYRSIYRDTQAVMYLLDPDTLDIVDANDAACSFYGYTKEKLTSMKVSDINTLSRADILAKAAIAKSMQNNYFQFGHRLASGEVRGVEVYSNPVTIKGKTYLFSIIHDITERNQLQRQLEELNVNLQRKVDEEVEKSRLRDQLMFEQSRHIAMSELLVNIAHQWRQPLNSVAVVAQDIRDAFRHGELDAKYLDGAIEALLSEVSNLSNTLDWFRRFHETEKEKISFTAAEAVGRSLLLMGEYFKSKGITLDVEMDGDVKIEGYPNEFSQAVLNVLTNAKDTFESRGMENGIIRVRLFRRPRGERAVLVIADNGGGIRQDVMDRIFDLYFTTKHKTRGTGLGLFMSKVIIESNMKGSISVRNADGWAEFTIEI